MDRDHETVSSPYLRSIVNAQPASQAPDSYELRTRIRFHILDAVCAALALVTFAVFLLTGGPR